MHGWNTPFLLGLGLFSGAFAVSFRDAANVWDWNGLNLWDQMWVNVTYVTYMERMGTR